MSEQPRSMVNGHAYEHRAVLALGGNLDRRLENIQAALDALIDTPGVVVTGVSSVYETEPFGGEPGQEGYADLADQPNYFNAVVCIATELPPHTLLLRTQAIEQALHRVREQHWAARTIDVDIIVYDDLVSADDLLVVPHPRAHERLFVLLPWRDIEPDAEIPGRGPICELIAGISGQGAVARRAELTLQV